MNFYKWLAPVLILGAGVLLSSRLSEAKPDYTKKTRKPCEYCHNGGWATGKLTEAGAYYKDHGTFKGYQPKAQPKKTSASPLPLERNSILD